MNPYETIGVEKQADGQAIKSAYRTLSKQHHPDKGGDPVKMAEISQAYAILSDPEKRKIYDETGKTEKIDFNAEVDGWLNKALSQALQEQDTTYKNLIPKTKRLLEKDIKNLEAQIPQIESKRDNYREIIDKKCGDSENKHAVQLRYMLTQIIDQMDDHIGKIKHQIKIAEAASEKIKALESDDDECVITWTATSTW